MCCAQGFFGYSGAAVSTGDGHRGTGTRRGRPWPRPSCAGVLAVAGLGLLPATGRADEAGTSLYVRTDNDHTTVVSPRVSATHQITDATSIEGTYAVDVWTSASIDIVSSATKASAITEQRDEVDLVLDHDLEDATLGLSYRFSSEYDYTSHGATLSGSRDFANKAATLAGSLSLSRDSVGRAGDPSFSEGLGTIDTRLSFTQIIDTSSLAQATYELMLLDGYQASPYRFVAIFDSVPEPVPGMEPDVSCRNTTMGSACYPELLPKSRTRHALALQARHAFGSRTSAGLEYRFYLDDWGLTSHTAQAHFTWLPLDPLSLTLRYRYYSQTGASFYRAAYTREDAMQLDGLTRDRELSPLNTHRVGLDLTHDWELGDIVLHSVVGFGLSLFSYDDFVGLDSVTAYEITTALGVREL